MSGPYSLMAYVRDRKRVMVLGASCVVLVYGMGRVLGLGVDGAGVMALMVAAFLVAALLLEFMRRRRFYRELREALVAAALVDDGQGAREPLVQAYQLPELVSRPSFLEGQVLYDALVAVARADAALLSQERKAAQDNQEFVTLWTHEVKTPIAASKLMLSRMHGEQAEALRRELERIEAACERALYSARMADLNADYVIRTLSLRRVCADACTDLASVLMSQGVVPKLEIEPETCVLADGQWVRFVVKQVVSNAGKYGASTIRFCAETLEENTPRGRTVLSIVDDGVGIPADEVSRVFRQGYSGTNGRADGASTGMGLYLADKACRAMGIGLSLSSEEGHGTRVDLVFPHDRSNASLGRPNE